MQCSALQLSPAWANFSIWLYVVMLVPGLEMFTSCSCTLCYQVKSINMLIVSKLVTFKVRQIFIEGFLVDSK